MFFYRFNLKIFYLKKKKNTFNRKRTREKTSINWFTIIMRPEKCENQPDTQILYFTPNIAVPDNWSAFELLNLQLISLPGVKITILHSMFLLQCLCTLNWCRWATRKALLQLGLGDYKNRLVRYTFNYLYFGSSKAQ